MANKQCFKMFEKNPLVKKNIFHMRQHCYLFIIPSFLVLCHFCNQSYAKFTLEKNEPNVPNIPCKKKFFHKIFVVFWVHFV